MKAIKILIADDQTLFAESLSRVLESLAEDISITGIAPNGKIAVDMARETTPDLVLLDVRMPVMDGVEAACLIHKNQPDILIMMLTTFDDDTYVLKAMDYGASGYLLKDVPLPDLLNSIRAIMSGTVQMSPKILSRLMGQSTSSDTGESNSGSETLIEVEELEKLLSERELEVLFCLSLGLDNTRIAARLFLAEQTVKNHLSKIYSKLGVHERMQARRLAINAHLDRKLPWLSRLSG